MLQELCNHLNKIVPCEIVLDECLVIDIYRSPSFFIRFFEIRPFTSISDKQHFNFHLSDPELLDKLYTLCQRALNESKPCSKENT